MAEESSHVTGLWATGRSHGICGQEVEREERWLSAHLLLSVWPVEWCHPHLDGSSCFN